MSKVLDTTTPPTKQLVDASEWANMNINELYEQKMILQNRIFAASDIRNQPLRIQLERGMQQLEAIIQQKSAGETIVI